MANEAFNKERNQYVRIKLGLRLRSFLQRYDPSNIDTKEGKQTEGIEIWMWHRMLNVIRQDRITNGDILGKIKEQSKLLKVIKNRRHWMSVCLLVEKDL